MKGLTFRLLAALCFFLGSQARSENLNTILDQISSDLETKKACEVTNSTSTQATNKPAQKSSSSASASARKSAQPAQGEPKDANPELTPNSHGVPDGTYRCTSVNSESGTRFSFRTTNYFVVHGNSYEWFRKTEILPTGQGRSLGEIQRSWTLCLAGSISKPDKDTIRLKPRTLKIVARSPNNLPDSETSHSELRPLLGGSGVFGLTYANRRLFEPSSGKQWLRSQ